MEMEKGKGAESTVEEHFFGTDAERTKVDECKVLGHLEVGMRRTSSADRHWVGSQVMSFVSGLAILREGRIRLTTDSEAFAHVESVTLEWLRLGSHVDAEMELMFWQVQLTIDVYKLFEEEPQGLWDSLIYEDGRKMQLIAYANAAMQFSAKAVDPALISWNRVVLIHGPPGTGKTSVCRGLAQKLSISLSREFSTSQLVEVNAHSLFSKWFSESGKLVGRLFARIQELADDPSNFVSILIDEVESLASARQSALSGTEPGDAIRVVNAVLTQLDALRYRQNVLVMATSNVTEAIDLAFIDRADIKMHIGPPGTLARERILVSSLTELSRTGVIDDAFQSPSSYRADELIKSHFDVLVACTSGFSGRLLRKLPFLAYAAFVWEHKTGPLSSTRFLDALLSAAKRERKSCETMVTRSSRRKLESDGA